LRHLHIGDRLLNAGWCRLVAEGGFEVGNCSLDCGDAAYYTAQLVEHVLQLGRVKVEVESIDASTRLPGLWSSASVPALLHAVNPRAERVVKVGREAEGRPQMLLQVRGVVDRHNAALVLVDDLPGLPLRGLADAPQQFLAGSLLLAHSQFSSFEIRFVPEIS
jgi:hypothetical protein